MHIRDLNGKTVCILGFGREGQAMLKALEEYAPRCRVTIADKNKELRIKNDESQLGEDYLENLDRFDVIIKSPGIPPSTLATVHQKPETRNQKPIVTTPTQIFFDSIRDSGAMVIGITGSKGKSTTASLLHHILESKNQKPETRNLLIGNIGEPAIAHIKDAKPGAIFTMEMSSYQLMDVTVSPHITVVTAFFPEHLDYHGSLDAYKEAKKHITRFQTKDDLVFFAADSQGAREIAEESKGRKITFSAKDAPVTIEETRLIGAHNLCNIAAAFAVSQSLDIPKDAAITAIKNFQPLPHRLQSLGVHDGLEWVDDSISTTPESAIAALDALDDRVTTIILGGQDRGYDFSTLAKRLKHSQVQTVILLPDSGKTIGKALKNEDVSAQCVKAATMQEAVSFAKKHSLPPTPYPLPPVVLLSPASPSYGMFINFEDRGNQFRSWIEQR